MKTLESIKLEAIVPQYVLVQYVLTDMQFLPQKPKIVCEIFAHNMEHY